jgi:NDP-sugar pyrophosphorylase family protein
MLQVDGRPLMELIVQHLRESGIRQINVTTHFKPEKIVEHFGDGQAFGVDIRYVNEDRPLGTGGALGLMPTPTETTLVINGDVLTQVDFRIMLTYHREHRADMTVAVSQYVLSVPYGVVECDGPLVRTFKEKPQFNFLVNAGIYLLEPAVYQFVSSGEVMHMTDLIARLLEAGRRVVSFPIFEQWLDIGQHADYARAQKIVHRPGG